MFLNPFLNPHLLNLSSVIFDFEIIKIGFEVIVIIVRSVGIFAQHIVCRLTHYIIYVL